MSSNSYDNNNLINDDQSTNNNDVNNNNNNLKVKNEEGSNDSNQVEAITTTNIDIDLNDEDDDLDEEVEEIEDEEPVQPQKRNVNKKNKKINQSEDEDENYSDPSDEEEEEEEDEMEEEDFKKEQIPTRRRGRPSKNKQAETNYTPDTRGKRLQSNTASGKKRQRSDEEKDESSELDSGEDSLDINQGTTMNSNNNNSNNNSNNNNNNNININNNSNKPNEHQPEKPQRGRPKNSTTTTSRSEERKRIQLQQYLKAKAQNEVYDDEEEEDDDDDDEKNKGKKGKKPTGHQDIRPCWFIGCVKADRSLKILRPCLIPTCKTHAIKSELRISDALKRGDFVKDETSGAKDKVCGICGDKKDLQYCSNGSCSFGFCKECVEIATLKHNNQVHGNKWICWVCQYVRLKGKEKERTRWVKEQLNPGLPSIGRKYRRALEEVSFSNTGTPERRQQQVYDPSISPNQQPNKRLRKKINENVFELKKNKKTKQEEEDIPSSPNILTTTTTTTTSSTSSNNNNSINNINNNNNNKVIHEQGFPAGSHNPPSPNTLMNQQLQQLQQTHQQARQLKATTPESVLSPVRQNVTPVDNFIDQTFNAVKYFTTLSTTAPTEIKEKIEMFIENVMRIKTVRWSSNYDLVWRMIEDLSGLIKKNLGSSQAIMEMYKELKNLDDSELENMTNNSHNVPLERAITMVFDNHETAGLIGKECCSTRNALIYSIEMALRSVADYQRDLELTIVEETVRNNKVASEIEQIDEQIKTNLGEIHKFKFQEVELLDSLSKVRGAIAAHEAIRDTLQKKSNDLKVDMLLIKNNISNKEKETKSQQATLENEVYALKLIINMVESIYWIHDYFYESKVGECEKLINSKLQLLQNKLDLQIPRIQSLLYDANGNPMFDPLSKQLLQQQQGIPQQQPRIDKFKTLAIYHKICMKHKVPNFHLEKPDRIQVTVGCINEYAENPLVDILDNPPEVDMRYVMAVHDANYIKKLETSLPPENSELETHLESDKSGAMVTVASHKDFEGDDDNIYDTFVSHLSMKAALRAAGSVCAAVDAVSRAGYTRSFCAIRPPGHHAGRYGRTSDAPSQGYCLINNVAIGAKYASLTANYSRIAVVDFDVHHGNGTQEILSGDDNFLFISIHVCDEKRYFYPGTGQDVGEPDVSGKYEGNILNIGLKRNTGSGTFLNQWVNKIIPRLEAYKPQLIFLSAGFDGHKDDPTNGLKLNEEDYFVITKMIKTVAFKYCKGRIISVLEGGYGIEKSNSLQRCVNAHLKALIEDTDEEINLANISFGHFTGDVSNNLIPKFNINNFISNPNKRGKKHNLNTINFISNNMNNINNTISSINRNQNNQQQLNNQQNNINNNNNNNNNQQMNNMNNNNNQQQSQQKQLTQQFEQNNNNTPPTTTNTTSSSSSSQQVINIDSESQNNSSSSSSPILISGNNNNDQQIQEEIQEDILEIKNPSSNNNGSQQPSSPIGVNRLSNNISINMSGAQRGNNSPNNNNNNNNLINNNNHNNNNNNNNN